MIPISLTGNSFLQWRKKMLLLGGRKVDLDWLLDIAAGVSWSNLQKIIINPENHLSLDVSIDQLEIIWKFHLINQIPLQYLIAKSPWREFELEISAEALIPRQETEFLIDFALTRVSDEYPGRWADLGTGAGPLAISLAKALPNWTGHAVDISSGALELAKRNLNLLAPNSNVEFLLGDWWQPLQKWWGDFDLVLSNPPYIPSKLIADLEPVVKNHEPHIALDGGVDGMDASQKVIYGAMMALSKGGWLILEHHYDQSEKVTKLMEDVGMEEVSFEKDLNGIKRFAICRK